MEATERVGVDKENEREGGGRGGEIVGERNKRSTSNATGVDNTTVTQCYSSTNSLLSVSFFSTLLAFPRRCSRLHLYI